MPTPVFSYPPADAEILLDSSTIGEWAALAFETAKSFLTDLMANPTASFVIGACIFFIVLKIITKIGGTLMKAIIIAALAAFLLSVVPTLSINFGFFGFQP